MDKLKYDINRFDVRDVTKGPHAVEQTVEPKWNMASIITQLIHLVLTIRYQVVKMRQYIRESKEWLTAYDWKRVRPKLGFTIRTLLMVRYRFKPFYPEGDLVRVDKVFWLNNNYEMPITEMDHRIDQVSDKIIKKYKDDGHPVNTDSDDRDHSKKICQETSVLCKQRENGQLLSV